MSLADLILAKCYLDPILYTISDGSTGTRYRTIVPDDLY